MLKDEGALWVIGSYHNIFRVGAMLQDLGFWILNDMVWRKSNPMPNFRGRRFTNAHETLIWAAKSAAAKNYTFNYEAMKAANDELPDALGLAAAALHRRRAGEGRRRAQGASDAEARGPAARVLHAASQAGDLCSIRSSATGTTGAVAKRLGRSFIGIERDETYAAAARARIAAVEPYPDEAISVAPSKRAQPRVAFASVVEAGLIAPGAMLCDEKRRHRALVRADGTLALAGAGTELSIVGSIHKVGALAQGLPACNGWTFWHVERDGRLAPLDDLRATIRGALKIAAE